MRTDPAVFAAQNTATARQPRFVVKIEFETESLFLTSHAGIESLPGVVIENVLQETEAISQRLVPEEARSEIGTFSFSVVDVDAAFTTAVQTRLQAGQGLKGKTVRYYLGYATQRLGPLGGFGAGDFGEDAFGAGDDAFVLPESDFTEFALFITQVIDDVSYKDGVYEVSCVDITREQRKDVFEVKTTTLRASVSSTDTTIPVYSTTGFQPVLHGASYSDAPSSTVGYIRLKDEVIRYTGVTADSFTGCTRGVLNTRAAAHEVDAGATADRRPKVEEYVYLELPAVKLAYAILTGVIYGTSSSLPPHWHCGIDTALIKLSDFTGIGTDLWDSTSDTTGFVCRFEGVTKTTAKQFLQAEVFQLCGCYQPVYSDGRLGLRRMNAVLADSAGILQLDETNVISYGQLTHDYGAMRNQIRLDWNWNGKEFTRTTQFIDATSVSVHGASDVKTLKFKGLHGSLHTDALIRARIDSYRDRFSQPPERLQADVLASDGSALEVGDVVRVVLDSVRDFAGNATSIDRAFEIQQKTEDHANGKVSLALFGSTGKASTDATDMATTALPDAYYTAEGTELSTVCTINVVGGVGVIQAGTYDLAGDPSMNAADAVYYYDGPLQLASGATLTVNQNTQIRVKGFFTVNGTIDGVGRGKAGQAGVGTYGTQVPGLPGFLGNSRGGDGFVEEYNPNRTDAVRTLPAAMTLGQYSAFPYLALRVAGNSLIGLPDDMSGTSGGAGGEHAVYSFSLGAGIVYRSGGTGGDSGAGLAIICRGFAFGGSGEIDLSGEDAADPVIDMGPTPGAGGGGTPGGLFIGLDGSGNSVPDLGGRFVAVSGQAPATGSPMLVRGPTSATELRNQGWSEPRQGFNDPARSRTLDMSDAAYRIQYIPELQTPETDSSATRPTGLVATALPLGVGLTWDPPAEDQYSVIEIYRATTNDRTNAVRVDSVRGSGYRHNVDANETGYYWIRSIDQFGRHSDWYPSSSTGGESTTSIAVDTPNIEVDAVGEQFYSYGAGPFTRSLSGGGISSGPSPLHYFEFTASHDGLVWASIDCVISNTNGAAAYFGILANGVSVVDSVDLTPPSVSTDTIISRTVAGLVSQGDTVRVRVHPKTTLLSSSITAKEIEMNVRLYKR